MGVYMKWTLKELRYKLFGAKTCPVCKGPLHRELVKAYKGPDTKFNSRINADWHEFEQWYVCSSCDRKYSITELSRP